MQHKKFIRILLLSSLVLGSLSYQALAAPEKSKIQQSQKQMKRVNLNTASLKQLVSLPGVGKKKAAAIIEYRKNNGKFKQIEDVIKVKGIGQKMLDKFKNQLTLK